MYEIRRYGWIPGFPDQRDIKLEYSHLRKKVVTLPVVVDLRSKFPDCYDQGDLGSCTANAIAALYQYLLLLLKHGKYTPSRLMIYYLERQMEGTVNEDAGAMIRDGMKAAAKYGLAHEKLWPYDITKFKDAPSAEAYKDAGHHKGGKYYSVNNTDLNLMLTALAAGHPIVAGFSVYTSFESNQVAATGIVPMPKKNEKLLGGHAILIVGYDLSKKMFLVRNSWGVGWGEKGYCWMPFDYLTSKDLADDFWTAEYVA